MIRGRIGNFVRFLTLGMPLIGLLLSGEAARADCADHSRPILPIAAASLDHDSDPGDESGPRPCTGTTCSRMPAQASATPAPDRLATDFGMITSRPLAPSASAAKLVIAGPEPEYRAPFATPLVRPPRH